MSQAIKTAILALSARTITIELVGADALDRLVEPLGYRLQAAGHDVADGSMNRPVLTLEELIPDTAYRLLLDGAEALDFVTPAESLFVDIRDFGADPDARDNAAAINAAIGAAPDGATVYIPQGEWRSGPVFLKSDILFYLPEGACLVGLRDRTAYPILSAFDAEGRQQASWEGVPADCYASLITLADAANVMIAGKGILDGAGAEGDWWSWPKETRDGARRPRTIFANRCTDLAIAGVTVRNSPSWTIHPLDCSGLVFADLKIENPADSPNTDGLNPESCTTVLIAGVHFSVGDDCIAIKAGKVWPDGTVPQPTRGVTVRHCLMERGHGGVVIGSEMSGSVTDVDISHCRFIDTDRGLRIKTRRGRGGAVARIAMRDCEMDGVETPLVVNAHYFCDPDGKSDAVQNRAPSPVGPHTPKLSDISFQRIRARNVHHAVAYVLGLAEAPLTGLVIEDIEADFAPHAVAAPPAMALGVSPLRHAGITVENSDAPVIRNITLPNDTKAREAV